MIEYKELGWWYWLVTVCLLSVGLIGIENAFVYAISLTFVQLMHFAVREHSVTAFTVQVRFWFLILLLIAYPKPLNLIYWLPTIGTWAQVIFGYCTMARCVSLLPWNRTEALSLRLVKKTFLSRPVRGSIIQQLPPV